jgi:hypothetical protein
MTVKAGFKSLALDNRGAVLKALGAQGLDSTGDAVLRNFLQREARVGDLRDELQPAALDSLLRETGAELVDLQKTIRLEAASERNRVAQLIEGEARQREGQHVSAADAVDFMRLRESHDVNELRQILDGARRAGDAAFSQALAIVKPRLQKMAGSQLGITRAVVGPTALTSAAFTLLCELPRLGRLDAQSRLDVVDRRRDARLRLVLDAAGRMHPRLPQVVQAIEADAQRTQSGTGPDTTIVFGRYWESKAKK